MNVSFFIAKRLRYQESEAFSATVIKIATISIALGIAVMLVAFAVLEGFRENISQKVFSFGAHVNITRFNSNDFFEEEPISIESASIKKLSSVKGVERWQSYIFKPGLLKTDEAVQGVVVKGMDTSFNAALFSKNIVEGRLPVLNDTNKLTEVIISQKIAKLLMLKPSDEVLMYFMQQPTRLRKLQIVGLYETGMEEFDENVIIGNAQMLREINGWPDSLASGVEVFIYDYQQLNQTYEAIENILSFEMSAVKITDRHIQIFEWLEMIGRNVEVMLVLITLVACFSIISSLLIMILERTRMVGILKSLGATNSQIRNIFVWSGLQIVFRGLVYGNITGIGLCALQYYFKIIPLDPENYYMYHVPIAWNMTAFLLLNVITLVLATLILLIPTRIIAGIQPIKAIKFD